MWTCSGVPWRIGDCCQSQLHAGRSLESCKWSTNPGLHRRLFSSLPRNVTITPWCLTGLDTVPLIFHSTSPPASILFHCHVRSYCAGPVTVSNLGRSAVLVSVRPSPSLTIVLRHSPHLQAAIVELHLRGNGCIHPADPRLPAIIMQRQGQPTLMPMIQRAIEVTIKLATSPFFMDVQMDFV